VREAFLFARDPGLDARDASASETMSRPAFAESGHRRLRQRNAAALRQEHGADWAGMLKIPPIRGIFFDFGL